MSLDAKPRLVDRVRHRLPLKHYSYRTEQQYVLWIRRFVLFHDKRHPEYGAREVEAFAERLGGPAGGCRRPRRCAGGHSVLQACAPIAIFLGWTI